MKIKILGTGCANCLKLEVLAMEVLTELGIRNAVVQLVDDRREIDRYLMGDPPGLLVDGEVVWAGGAELPPRETIARWLKDAVRQVKT